VNLDCSAFVADPELIQGLEKRSVHVACSEERILFSQGDAPAGLYILKSGDVTLTMNSPLGHALVSLEAAPDSLLGLPGLVCNQPYTLTATAHAGSHLSFLTQDSFADLMLAEPSLAFKVLQVLAAEVHAARDALREEFDAPPHRGRLTPSPCA
jgi:CRP/FNR family transcriptional regulator, cyclic AMP receptor protein